MYEWYFYFYVKVKADCQACKIVGSVGGIGGAVYILYEARKFPTPWSKAGAAVFASGINKPFFSVYIFCVYSLKNLRHSG